MVSRWVFAYAIVLHSFWGILLIFSGDPLSTTPLSGLNQVFHNRILIAGCLLGGAALAVIGLRREKRLTSTMLLIPQQLLLTTIAIYVTGRVFMGEYADGVQRSQAFLIADQAPLILVAIMHTMAILWIYGGYGWIRR